MRVQLLIVIALLCYGLLPAPCAAAEDQDFLARRLLNALGCKACHQFSGDGASLAPVLDQIGSRMTKEEIEQWLTNPTTGATQGFMPSYRNTPADELKILSEFLYNHR